MRDQKKADKLMEEIKTEFDTFESEGEKCLEGNSSAGARSRKSSSSLTKLFKEWRNATV